MTAQRCLEDRNVCDCVIDAKKALSMGQNMQAVVYLDEAFSICHDEDDFERAYIRAVAYDRMNDDKKALEWYSLSSHLASYELTRGII